MEHEHEHGDEGTLIELVDLIDIFPGCPTLTADLEERTRDLVQFLELVSAHVLLVVVVNRVQSLKLLLFQLLILLYCGLILLNVVLSEEVTLCGFRSLNLLSFGLLIRQIAAACIFGVENVQVLDVVEYFKIGALHLLSGALRVPLIAFATHF